MENKDILRWIGDSLGVWPEAAARHRDVAQARMKVIADYGPFEWRVTLLPARKVSTLAALDDNTIARRKCFLCKVNRPAEQCGIVWRDYEILVNPFPIFPNHLTIVELSHTPQHIVGRLSDMAALADELRGFTVIYNGAHSGASAPDHFHFQAVPVEYVDLRQYDWAPVYSRRFVGRDASALAADVERYIKEWGFTQDGGEMPMNIAMERLPDGNLMARVVPRRCHRPKCYPHPAISPGAIDMFGTFVTVSLEDFDILDRRMLEDILAEVAYPNPAHAIHIGIMTAENIRVSLNGHYSKVGDSYIAEDDDCNFVLEDVPVGSQFHWEHTERRAYPGTLELHRGADGLLTAVNVVAMERYLEGVIGAEMSPDSPEELLKAHTVISRSWAFKQLPKYLPVESVDISTDDSCGEDEYIKWYDHDDHIDFDVCADDHCQRYLGIPDPAYADKLHSIICATAGEVLLDKDGRLCDTRFSKCCGGAFEEFEYCWEPMHHSYLEAALDRIPEHPLPDLRGEDEARRWILSAPDAFCAAPDVAVLRSVLNRSDLDTTPDFYRWRVEYTPEELSDIVRIRSGIDFGQITDLQTVERGKSGRIVRLRIVGTKRTMIVGKELEIRRWLSRSHLYSSAFVVSRGADGRFVLNGAGWGHGVGLCQIGAAVMASEGFDYRSILRHYFSNTTIDRY